MGKKIAGLLGAVAGLATVGAAQAAPQPAQNLPQAPSSYADLLAPIANPVEALQADNAARAQAPEVELAQYYYYGYRPYYNYRPYYYHHHRHHHHHHHSSFVGIPGIGGIEVYR
jgi:hypothetical protein